jgi:hypothetical protein
MLGGHLLVGEVRAWTAPSFGPTFLTAAGIALAVALLFVAGFPRQGREMVYEEKGE